MAILSAMVAALSSYYPDSLDVDNIEQRDITIARLISKVRTIAAFAYKEVHRAALRLSEELAHLLLELPEHDVLGSGRGVRNRPRAREGDEPSAHSARRPRAGDCSTSTVRVVGSSKANLFAAVSAGICALWGPLHGGANQEVLEMLSYIHQDGGDVQKYVKLAKEEELHVSPDGLRSPRVRGLRSAREDHQGRRRQECSPPSWASRTLCSTSQKALEEAAALKDSYFVERKLYPNVDFYSGIIYRAMGFPINMFTVLFALGRLPGWVAHWKEMMEDPTTKIARPRQIYTGPTIRDYVPVEKRS